MSEWISDHSYLVIVFPFALVIIPAVRHRMLVKRLQKVGKDQVGIIRDLSNTGAYENHQPYVRVTMDLQQAGQPDQSITFTQRFQQSQLPRIGDLVYVSTDPSDSSKTIITGAPVQQPQRSPGVSASTGAASQTGDQTTLDRTAISPRLREHGILAIATLLSIQPTADQSAAYTLEIDSVGTPKRTLTITQTLYGQPYQPGDRVYMLLDPDSPNSAAILPLSLTGGTAIPRSATRIDTYVLQPMLQRVGAQCTALLSAATQVSNQNASFDAKGYQTWKITLEVHPSNGENFETTDVMTLVNAEKVKAFTTIGTTVPVRYDPADPKTCMIDYAAMGFPDTSAAKIKAWMDFIADV